MKKLKEIFSTVMVWSGYLFYTDFCNFFSNLMRRYPNWEPVYYGLYLACDGLGLIIVKKYIHGSPHYSLEYSRVVDELHNDIQTFKSSTKIN